MGGPPNHPLDHFSIETHGDLGIPHFKKPPEVQSQFLQPLVAGRQSYLRLFGGGVRSMEYGELTERRGNLLVGSMVKQF